MKKPAQTALILASLATAAAAACASPGAPSVVETVPLIRLAAETEAWRGREVRTCGPDFRGNRAKGEWQLSKPSAVGYHPATVRVLSCPGVKPARDSNGCVSGRIARRDGSIEPTPDGADVIVTSAIMSTEWFLHAQCRASGR